MKRALVVDDEHDHAKLISYFLEELGYKTTIVHTLFESCAAMNRTTFDLITVDLILQGEKGEDLIEYISAHDPHVHTRVLIISVLNKPALKNKLLKKGRVHRYLTKPVTFHGLREALND